MPSCAQEQHNAYYYKTLGKSLSASGDKVGAIKAYDKAIKLNSQYDTVYYNRGNAKADLSDRLGAIEDYSKALELNPQYYKAYYNRALSRYEIGDYEGEIADYRLAIKNSEPDEDLYNNLGRALYDLKRFKESAEAYGEGIGDPSVSHAQGYNMDFRYIRSDRVDLGLISSTKEEYSKMDLSSQNTFIDALKDFGWSDILGHNPSNDTSFKVKHATGHDNHLLCQGYNKTTTIKTK